MDTYIIGSKEQTPADSDLIAVLDDPIGIDAAKLLPAAGDFKDQAAEVALISVEAGDVRFKFDGTDPVALTDGHLLVEGMFYSIEGRTALQNLRMVRESGSQAPVVQATLFWAGRKLQ